MPTTAALRPDASVSNNWTANGTFPSNLADAVSQPTAPGTGSGFISSSTAGQVAEMDLGTATLPVGATVTAARIWVYAAGGTKRAVGVTLKTGASVLAGSDTNRVVAAGAAAGWYSLEYSGSLTQGQIDALRIRCAVESTGGGGASAATVYAAYAEVDYTSVTTYERSSDVSAVTAIATAATFFHVLSATVGVSAASATASAGYVIRAADVAASASAGVTTAGQRALLRATGASATGDIATSGVNATASRSVAVSAVAGASTAGQRDLLRQAGAGAATGTTTAGLVIRERATAAGAAADASVSGFQRELLRQIGASATGSIATSGQIAGGATTYERAADATAATSVTSSGTVTPPHERSATASAAGAITTAAQRDLLRAIVADAIGAIDATGARAAPAPTGVLDYSGSLGTRRDLLAAASARDTAQGASSTEPSSTVTGVID